MAKDLKKTKLAPAGKLTAVKDVPIKRVEPDEWYMARFTDVTMGKGTYGPYLKLTFKLLKGTLEGSEDSAKGHMVNRMVDATLSPSKPLWKIASGIIGREPEMDEEVDLKAFLGGKYRILIKDRIPKKDAQDQRIFQMVETVKGLKKKVKA